ncbi:MAG TPA: hypothetical protein VFX98_19985 [Longimicrobiaceae bacterium]|nr:hypothetical protein [Longimicrobiaceae bacterium]
MSTARAEVEELVSLNADDLDVTALEDWRMKLAVRRITAEDADHNCWTFNCSDYSCGTHDDPWWEWCWDHTCGNYHPQEM